MSYHCLRGRRKTSPKRCKSKPGRKRMSPCKHGVKKSGACKAKSGRKRSRSHSRRRSHSRKSKSHSK